MLLSIVVPTYNVEKYIANCLDSLLDQDLSADIYEILVINDGSTDNSPKIATKYSESHDNVIVVNQENGGLSEARNKGIALAKGKYIYFIDSDDYIAKNTLGLIMETLETHDLDLLGVDIIETSRLDLKISKNLTLLNTKEVNVTDGITYIAENKYLNNAWWYFIKLDFLRNSQLLFPTGRLVEDANFTAKLLVATKRFIWLPLDFYRYYMRPNSIMRQKKLSHIKRLVGDYEKNVHEFNEQLIQLRKAPHHPKLSDCIDRIETRKNSFIFFGLLKSLRFGLPKEEVLKTINGFKQINSYPITKFLGKDYNKLIYKVLLPLLNNERLFFRMLKIRSTIS